MRTNRGRLRLVEAAPPPAEKDSATPSTAGGLAPKRRSPSRPDGAGEAASATSATSATPIPAVESFPSEAPPIVVTHTAAGRAQIAALPDAQLVALGCKGEVQALEMLYRRHAAFAIHLAARIEGSARDVEDIAHDAFLRAFERLNDLSDRTAFRSWLGAIVVHAVRSRMRRARLMNVLGMGKSSEPVDLDAIASPDASPHTRAQIAQIYALLRTLPTDERIAWTLRCVEGHDLETVARLTRCSLATVKRRISRAQRFLDDHFVEPSASRPADPSDSAPPAPTTESPAESTVAPRVAAPLDHQKEMPS